MQDCNRIFENFKIQFPRIADKVIDYYQTGDCEITINLQDGDSILYDDVDCSFRRLPTNRNCMSEDECRREFGKRLSSLLIKKCITQSDLSILTGIAQPQISNYITGKKTPSFYTVDKIAKALDCSVDYFRYV